MSNMNIDEKSLRAIVKNLERDVEKRPRDVATRLQLALSYMRLAEADKAREHLEKVIELDKRNVEAHYYLGILWADTGKLEEAKNAFKRTIALDRSHSPSHYFLGKIYALEGNLDAAISQTEKARDAAPGNVLARVQWSCIWPRAGSGTAWMNGLKS